MGTIIKNIMVAIILLFLIALGMHWFDNDELWKYMWSGFTTFSTLGWYSKATIIAIGVMLMANIVCDIKMKLTMESYNAEKLKVEVKECTEKYAAEKKKNPAEFDDQDLSLIAKKLQIKLLEDISIALLVRVMIDAVAVICILTFVGIGLYDKVIDVLAFVVGVLGLLMLLAGEVDWILTNFSSMLFSLFIVGVVIGDLILEYGSIATKAENLAKSVLRG